MGKILVIRMKVNRALSRARIPILSVGLTYLISVVIGFVMVQSGNLFAVSQRDRTVSNAQSSPSIVALEQNNRLKAALLDFRSNLIAAISDTLGGLGVIFPYPIIAYRGWIGGIVSIDSSHISRLADPQEAVYYLVTLVLQLIPYTIACGAGVNIGLALFRPKPYYQGEKWLGIPKEAIHDALRIYLIVVPLFLVASLWEFYLR